MITCITVRGKKVSIVPHKTCQYYDASYYTHDHLETLDLFIFKDFNMEDIIDYLTEGSGEWTRHANTKVPSNLT